MSTPHADKRSVATDALETLGTIIDENQKRDAIHLAVEPIVSMDEWLKPGDHVGLVEGGASASAEKLIGIVDPFLDVPVARGERFWLVVYPRVINSLRHVWTHPDFADEPGTPALPGKPSRAISEAWLKEFAERFISYGDNKFDELISGLNYGGYFGTDIEYLNDDSPDVELLRVHYENYTGKDATWEGNHFHCSC